MADLTTIIELVGLDAGASRAAREVSSALDGLTGSAGRSNAALALGATALGAVVVGMGAAAAAVTALGLAFNAQKEQAEIAFTTMIGSADAAKRHIKDLTDFAKTTPFQLGGLIETSQRVQALGFDVKTVIPLLTTIGDAAAGLSLGQEGINRITLALGQMQAKGHAAGGELLQLTEAGIPALRFIAEGIGKTQAETSKLVEAGAISSNTAIHFILSGMEQRFGGLMEKQSHSLIGLLSNVQDFASQLSGTVMEPVFVRLKGGLENLTNAMAGPEFQANAAKMSQILDVTLTAAERVIKALSGPVGKAFADISGIAEAAFGGDMKTATTRLETLLSGWAKTVSGWVTGAWNGLKDGLAWLGGEISTWVTTQGVILKDKVVNEWVPAFLKWVENDAKPKLITELTNAVDALNTWVGAGEGKDKTQAIGESIGKNILAGLAAEMPASGLRDYLAQKWAIMGGEVVPPDSRAANIGSTVGSVVNKLGGPDQPRQWPTPTGNLQDQARQIASAFNLDPEIFVRQIQQESGFNAGIGSPAGARGIGQFMPGTAAGVAAQMSRAGMPTTANDIMTDATAGLRAAAFHMNDLLSRYGGNYASALSAYNAGPGATPQGGIAPWDETRRYVQSILGGNRPMRGAPPSQTLTPEDIERLQAQAAENGATPPTTTPFAGPGGTTIESIIGDAAQGIADAIASTFGSGDTGGPSEPAPKASDLIQADAPFRLSSGGFLKSFGDNLSVGMGDEGLKVMTALQKAIEAQAPATEEALGKAAASMIANIADKAPPEQAGEWIDQIMASIDRAVTEQTPEATAAVGDLFTAINLNLPMAKLGDEMATRINTAKDQAIEQITDITTKTQTAIDRAIEDLAQGRADRRQRKDFTEGLKFALDAELDSVRQLKQAYHDMREDAATARADQRAAEDLTRTRTAEGVETGLSREKQLRDFRRQQQGQGVQQMSQAGGMNIINAGANGSIDEMRRVWREEDAELKRKRGLEDAEIVRRKAQAAGDRAADRVRREEDRLEDQRNEDHMDSFRRNQANDLQNFEDGMANSALGRQIARMITARDEQIAKANERLDIIEDLEIKKYNAAVTRQNFLNTLADHYLQSLQAAEGIQTDANDPSKTNPTPLKGPPVGTWDPNNLPTNTGNPVDAAGGNIVLNNPQFVGPGGMDDVASFLSAVTSRKMTIAGAMGV